MPNFNDPLVYLYPTSYIPQDENGRLLAPDGSPMDPRVKEIWFGDRNYAYKRNPDGSREYLDGTKYQEQPGDGDGGFLDGVVSLAKDTAPIWGSALASNALIGYGGVPTAAADGSYSYLAQAPGAAGGGSLTSTVTPVGGGNSVLANIDALDAATGAAIPAELWPAAGAGAIGVGAASLGSGLKSALSGLGASSVLSSLLGPAVGGALGLTAADRAANAQLTSAREANALLDRQFQQTREDLAPWREAGTNALARIQSGMQAGGELSEKYPEYVAMPDFQYQDFNFEADPGYNFRLEEGLKAVKNNRNALGILRSGATAKALNDYAQGSASQEYGNAFNRYTTGRGQAFNEWGGNSTNRLNAYNTNFNRFRLDQGDKFNRLAALAGIGQTANQQLATAGQSNANTIANNLTSAGAVQGASGIAGANAISGAIGQAYNNMNSNALLELLKNQQTPQARTSSYAA